MAGLHRNTEGSREGKYLVLRRDGTVPQFIWFVLGSRDPAAPDTLRFYAGRCLKLGKDPQYVADLLQLANDFEADLVATGEGDPDAPKHRTDAPWVIDLMRQGRGA